MSLSQSVRYSWRSLRRTPVFTVTAVATLAIGIGASAAIFAVVNGVLLRPLPYGHQDGAENVADPAGGTEPQRLRSALITANLIPLLEVSPKLGRSFTEAEDQPNGPAVVIISEGMWRTRFGGDRAVIGHMLQVAGTS